MELADRQKSWHNCGITFCSRLRIEFHSCFLALLLSLLLLPNKFRRCHTDGDALYKELIGYYYQGLGFYQCLLILHDALEDFQSYIVFECRTNFKYRSDKSSYLFSLFYPSYTSSQWYFLVLQYHQFSFSLLASFYKHNLLYLSCRNTYNCVTFTHIVLLNLHLPKCLQKTLYRQ